MTYAQNILWQKCLGGNGFDRASSYDIGHDGSYIVVGSTRSTDGMLDGREGYTSDIWAMKINAKGMVLWQKFIGGKYNEEATCVRVTKDGGFIIAGWSDSKDDKIQDNHGKKDFFLVRLDAVGSVLWMKSYGGQGNDMANVVLPLQDGSFLVAGSTGSNTGQVSRNRGANDFWVIQVTAKGDLIWEKNIGGESNESVNCAVELSDGYLVGGSTDSKAYDVPGNKGKTDLFLVKLDKTGGMVWAKNMGGESFDEPHAMCMSLTGNILIAGTSFSTTGDIEKNIGEGDVWVLMIQPDGNIVWKKNYGGSLNEGANFISPTFDGGYLIAATSNSNNEMLSGHKGLYDAWILKIRQDGSVLWKKSWGGKENEGFAAVREIPSGDYVAVGYTESSDADIKANKMSGPDFWVLSLRDPISPPQAISLTPTTLIGYIRDEETDKFISADAYLVEISNNKKIQTDKSDTTFGIYQLILPDTHQMSVGFYAPGYFFYGTNVKVSDANRYSEMRMDVKLKPIKKGSTLELKNIYFDIGKWNLRSESFPELDRVVTFLNQNKNVRISVNGHTDATGDKSTKLLLSSNRALEVKAYLMKKGIDPKRLEHKGFGMSKPIADEATEEGRQKNRRVEIEVLSF